MQDPAHSRLNLIAGLASVGVAATLIFAKLWAFSATGALSVAASLADSGLDLMISLAGLIAISYALRPPDADHAFGHTSAEDLAALAQSAFISVSGVVIIVTALSRLLHPESPRISAEWGGIWVMIGSIALTLALVFFQRHVARITGNKVVQADSLHYLGDLIPSLGAIISLAAAAQFGLTFIDSIVAMGAGAFMILASYRIGKTAFDALMDRQAPHELITGVAEIVAKFPGVRGHHDLKTRMAGSRVFVTLHIELDAEQSLSDAHDISAGLRQEILRAYPHTDVMIHKDVWTGG